MPRFSPEAESALRRSGWFPDRRVNITRWKATMPNFAWNAEAEEFLAEFGGVRVENDGPGITCARESFEFDPELAIGEEGRFSELSEFFGLGFFPLGEVGQGEFFLAIDEEGILYLLGSWAFRLGVGDLALEHLVTGVAAERLDLPTGNAP
ncbi:SUKH-3 domain-containing protein [Streptomyces sp. NPDC059892]|uniref:SUKH-3 domain-containing protein n=1 Tax=Streptomyces sp. NPDC059892 TaxID=3346989 RepID=UPI00365DA366